MITFLFVNNIHKYKLYDYLILVRIIYHKNNKVNILITIFKWYINYWFAIYRNINRKKFEALKGICILAIRYFIY